jgi:hypothetical protein
MNILAQVLVHGRPTSLGDITFKLPDSEKKRGPYQMN